MPLVQKNKIDPINYVSTGVFSVHEKTMLKDLLLTYQGNSIHWAACSFVKDNFDQFEGYGYACKLKANSLHHHFYKNKEDKISTKSSKTLLTNKILKNAYRTLSLANKKKSPHQLLGIFKQNNQTKRTNIRDLALAMSHSANDI